MKNKFQTPGETYEERKQYWLERIAEARSYPGGILKYCRNENITKEIYYHWFRKLKNEIESWQTPLDTNTKLRKRPPKTKSSRKLAPPRTQREWRALVAQCKESGLTPSAFAREHNIHKVTFCRWYRAFFDPGLYRASSKKQRNDFVPVKIIEPTSMPPECDSDGDDVIEILLHKKRTIRVRVGCSPEFLKLVVSALEES
jgi:transposase-like protein